MLHAPCKNAWCVWIPKQSISGAFQRITPTQSHCRRAAQKMSTKRKATQLLLTPAPAAAAALCTKVGPLGYSMVLLGGWGVRFMQRSCMFCLGDPKWALPFPKKAAGGNFLLITYCTGVAIKTHPRCLPASAVCYHPTRHVPDTAPP